MARSAEPPASSPAASGAPRPLTLAEQTCLALVVGGATHGWAVGSLLAPDGEIGRVFTLSRPLTYRAIDTLVERRLIARGGATAGRAGAERTLLRATAAGRRASAEWLATPVGHLRDVRTELLVKLTLLRRAGQDTDELLRCQIDALTPTMDALAASPVGDDPVDIWRNEHSRAVRRFLERALHPVPDAVSRTPLRISARNQLTARVVKVRHGDVMSVVTVVLPDGQQLTAAITRAAAEDLDLAADDPVVVIVKATETILAKLDG
jgi:molybdopterin-binding protein